MQEKISISVDAELIKKADQLIDGISVKKRSQAFEKILRDYFSSINIKKAIILLAKSRPNKEFLLKNIKKLEELFVGEVLIAGGKNNDDIQRFLSNERFRLSLTYLEEEKLLGTAGIIHFSKNKLNSNFIVMAGDTLFDFDIKKMVEFHNKNNNLATIGLTTMPLSKSTDKIDVEGNKIISFEYKATSSTYLTNAGIYVFSPEIFSFLPKEGSLERDVFPKLCRQGKLSAFFFNENLVKIT
jgi:NDP-sugar pyrophosphorylase family protein